MFSYVGPYPATFASARLNIGLKVAQMSSSRALFGPIRLLKHQN